MVPISNFMRWSRFWARLRQRVSVGSAGMTDIGVQLSGSGDLSVLGGGSGRSATHSALYHRPEPGRCTDSADPRSRTWLSLLRPTSGSRHLQSAEHDAGLDHSRVGSSRAWTYVGLSMVATPGGL